MLFLVSLPIFLLTLSVLSTPVHKTRHLHRRRGFPPKHINRVYRNSVIGRDAMQMTESIPTFSRQSALNAQSVTQRKFQNAPALLANQGSNPAFAISPSLQDMYDRASDQATNLGKSNSPAIDPFIAPAIFSPGVVVTTGAGVANNFTYNPLTDEVDGNDDLEYYGPLNFGSQAQPLTIDFDTGSADLWVPVNCSDCGNLEQFQASSSSTYQKTDQYFEVTYGIGQVSGTLASDTVSIGPFNVTNQYFGAVDLVSENFAQSPNDGLAGLAFSTISNSRQPTFFENLISQGFVQAPLFSVYLTRGQIQGSEICFGCVDVSKASEDTVQWIPVVSQTYWTVAMEGVSVNGSRVSTQGLNGIIDTGTSFLYVPKDKADDIYALIPGSAPALDYGDGYYYYPCDSQVQISFVFNEQEFALDPQDFNLGVSEDDSSICVGAIIGSGPDGIAIIGDSFLKSYVSVYDYSHNARVGFVKSITE